MPKPSVTIIIASYNASGTIGRAIQSALAEPEVAEVVVVDDASTDNTVYRARAADDGSGRLKILGQPENAGPSAARNRAIFESTAPWIGVLDADDYFLPGRIADLLRFAEESDFIADDMMQIHEGSTDAPGSLLGDHPPPPQFLTFEFFVNSNVPNPERQRGELGFLKPLMRRAFLAAHGLSYKENMRLGEDFELYARALAHGARFYLAPAQGYVSVMRPTSLSGQHKPYDLLQLRNCDQALENDFELSDAEHEALWQHYTSTDQRLQWRLLIDAVKKRDIIGALRCFCRPWPMQLYLCRQLIEQAKLRLLKQTQG